MIFLGFVDAFLQVLAIIGIIIVGGFVIFFLGDIVLSVLDPNYVRFGHRKKENNDEKLKEVDKEQTKELEFSFEDADENAFVKTEKESSLNINQEEVKEQADDIKEKEAEQTEEVDELKLEEEKFKQNMLKEIEERKGQQDHKDEINEFFFDDEDINVFNDEEPIEGQEQLELETPIEIEPQEEISEEENILENKEENLEEKDEILDEDEELNSEIENLKAQFEAEIEKLKAKNDELEKELAQKPEIISTTGIEEYENRLEVLKERLSANEKELRKIKKEYIPLRKVSKTLESDERKLRRKEALVAKQKVVLYGVNNIADIDEEKAKKLSEELDLLEGLKLSVQHCEEVMAANKDRYPILESTYNILINNNETLKADIKATEEAIEKLKSEEAGSEE